MYILDATTAEIMEEQSQGIVEREVAGTLSGRVKVMGVSWKARLCIPDNRCILPPGTTVTVFGRCGNTLLVLPTVP